LRRTDLCVLFIGICEECGGKERAGRKGLPGCPLNGAHLGAHVGDVSIVRLRLLRLLFESSLSEKRGVFRLFETFVRMDARLHNEIFTRYHGYEWCMENSLRLEHGIF